MAKSLVPIMIQISWFLLETGQNERGFALPTASSLSVVHHHTLHADYFYSLFHFVLIYIYIYIYTTHLRYKSKPESTLLPNSDIIIVYSMT